MQLTSTDSSSRNIVSGGRFEHIFFFAFIEQKIEEADRKQGETDREVCHAAKFPSHIYGIHYEEYNIADTVLVVYTTKDRVFAWTSNNKVSSRCVLGGKVYIYKERRGSHYIEVGPPAVKAAGF